ncbi:MAG: sensor histidine kinase [Nocardioidaceae bacterium]
MNDQVEIALIAAAGSGAVGIVGLLAVPLLRGASVRIAFAAVAVVAVGGFVAGLLGTANAMFLSDHDFSVVLLVCLVAGVVSLAFALLVARPVVQGSREVREVTRARRREQAAEDSRRRLVAWVSHDLRTPLASLRAMAEALEDGMVDEPARYHRQIRAEVDRTTDLVNDLFTLSRIHADALVLDLQVVDLGDLVSDALSVAEPLSSERSVALSGTAEPGLTLLGDAQHLQRVLGNLLTNAIRHTVPGHEVTVTAARDQADVVLSVADGCGGIPEDRLAGVFEAGLGLGIVRGIVQAHQGAVSVRNADDGCRFEVRLARAG